MKTYIQPISYTLLFFSLLLFPHTSQGADNKEIRDPLAEKIIEKPFVSYDENGKTWDGFVLKKDGTLQLINIFSMNGVRWELENKILTLYTSTDHSPENETTQKYMLSAGKLELHLIPLNSKNKAVKPYVHDTFYRPLEGIKWIFNYARNAPAVVEKGDDIFIRLDPKEKRAYSYSGNNHYNGPYTRDGLSVNITLLMGTMRWGPNADFEKHFNPLMQQVDSFIIVRDELYLYNKGNILFHFTAEK